MNVAMSAVTIRAAAAKLAISVKTVRVKEVAMSAVTIRAAASKTGSPTGQHQSRNVGSDHSCCGTGNDILIYRMIGVSQCRQ